MFCQQPDKSRGLESPINNKELDQRERTAGKHETICLTSIFGGTSIYWGIRWRGVDSPATLGRRFGKHFLQDSLSSSFSHVCFKLSTPVNLRPNPFSPTRRTSFLSATFTTNIFPVSLSLNLPPIFKMSTCFFTIPSPRSPSLLFMTPFNGGLKFERLFHHHRISHVLQR